MICLSCWASAVLFYGADTCSSTALSFTQLRCSHASSMRILRLVLLSLCALVASTTTVFAASCSSRVRKSWTQLSQPDKTLYLGALQSAMKSREFFEFSKIHMERMSEMQAHSTCAFFLWHKRFLLAFENMLRAQGPQFECVTVPYWDTMKEYAEMIDGKCDSLYSCSAIVREMGGSLDSATQSRTMSGETVEGPCYQSFAGESYCDDTGACGCVPRGDLAGKLPSSTDYAGIFHQIAYSASFEEFSLAVQNGVHNEMHNAIGGFMGTFTSPIDPLFWSWHATIDMLLYVYHQCHVSSSMTSEEVRTSVYGFSQGGGCRYTNDAPMVSVTSQLVQQSESDGVMTVASKNKLLGKYFVDLPDSVADYVSYRPDAANGYTYEIPEAFNGKLLQSSELCRTYWSAWKDGSKRDAESTTAAPSVALPNSTQAASVNSTPPATHTSASATPSPASPTAPTSSSQAVTTLQTPRPTLPAAQLSSTPSPSPPSTATPSKTPSTPPTHSVTDFSLFGRDSISSTVAVVHPDPLDIINSKVPTPTGAAATGAKDSTGKTALVTVAPTATISTTSSDAAVANKTDAYDSTGGVGSPASKATNVSTTATVVVANSSTATAAANSTGLGLVVQVGNTTTVPSPSSEPSRFTVVPVVSDGAVVNDKGKYWDWYSTSRRQLTTVFPGNITEIARQMEFTACITFGSAFGLRGFSADFVKRFRLKDNRVHCQVKAELVASGKSHVAIQAKAFSSDQVQICPGVTPAPPVDPAASFKQYQEQVVTLSAAAKATPVAESHAVSLTATTRVVATTLVGLMLWLSS